MIRRLLMSTSSAGKSVSKTSTQPLSGLLEGPVDTFKCMMVDLELHKTPAQSNVGDFSVILQKSLANWKKKNLKAAWIRVPLQKSHLIPFVLELDGVEAHSASKDHFVFSVWLRGSDEKNSLPRYAHTTVGVGGFVYDARNDNVLVVRERSGPAAALNLLKIPGGSVDPGETIANAAEREVFEETGVKARFQYLVGLREAHNTDKSLSWSLLGRTNFYCVAVLEPLNPSVELKPQAEEIAEAKWIKRTELLAQPQYQRGGVYQTMLQAASEAVTSRPNGFVKRELHSGFRKAGFNTLYFCAPPDDSPDDSSNIKSKL